MWQECRKQVGDDGRSMWRSDERQDSGKSYRPCKKCGFYAE